MVRIHWSLLSREGVKKAGQLVQDYMYNPGAPVQEPDTADKTQPQRLNQTQRDQIERQRKIFMVRRGLQAHPVVFVGNILPTFTHQDLHDFFSQCGTVLRVQIRCSQGCPTPMASSAPGCTPNTYYATVRFHNHTAVDNALSICTYFKGVKLQITISRRLLPEVRKCIADASKKKGDKLTNDVVPRRPIPCREQGTLILPDLSPDVNMLAGVAFPKTIV
ncbi:uncharacterized protein BT62DRAFT_676314 [Guyanagaster necrorhizus]|uniref:RRM domain-containing protein n=1 Tax=Guyanagaster necrorhizus TaxID=856835 RepID=A0A9P8AVG8_9AGAR|nr:uncharacterized protein BT62DRAFT_676314 [Guyanagaster necrorhizus MCA 3950]KAG7449300.1 hypothetical protein BT62DRAFT_676314 [Guyanagaster necrorhizus MCA 3950]